MTQDTNFRTHADRQKILDEIGFLSRSDLKFEEYLSQFLKLTIAAVQARGGAMWLPQGMEFQCACSANFAETLFTTDEIQQRSIRQAVRDTAQNYRPIVVAGRAANAAPEDPNAGIVNHTPFPFFYIPIHVKEMTGKGLVLAVVQLWLAPQLDPRAFKEIVDCLQAAGQLAAGFLRTRRAEVLSSNAEKLQLLLRLATELNGQLDPTALGAAVVNWGREITGCDRCALFGLQPDGKLAALAVSSVEVVDRKSSLVQAQLQLAEESLSAGQPTLFRKSTPKTEAQGDLGDYFFHSQSNEALTIPLVGRTGQKNGVLLLESHKDKVFDPTMNQLGSAVAAQAGRALEAVQTLQSIPCLPWLRRLQRTITAWQADRQKWLLFRIVVPVSIVLVLALWPWKFYVGGECSVMPHRRAVAVTEVGGRIVTVLVSEGQTVTNGQVLARTDDTEVQQSLRIAEHEKARYEAEADRLQLLGDDGGRRAALLQADQLQRQLEQHQRRLAKTAITSPLDGIVLTKDLATHVGELLPMAGRFCEIGDSRQWELMVRLEEGDVGVVDQRLRRGQPLPADFLLRSMPGRKLRAMVPNGLAISQLSYQFPHANVFLVRADVAPAPELQAAFKAGYTGQGEIALGWRPLGYVATRRFLSYIRIHWLF